MSAPHRFGDTVLIGGDARSFGSAEGPHKTSSVMPMALAGGVLYGRAMYFEMLSQMKKMLGQVDGWFDKAAAYAEEKKFDPDRFVGFRLAPDQFELARQVQAACDTAKLAASRLGGNDAPVQADDEATLEQLRARVKSVVAYLDGFVAEDFADAATRVITQPRWEGKVMSGADYFIEHAVPNFFFHLNTTYAILRHNGVPVGKRDYLGALSRREP